MIKVKPNSLEAIILFCLYISAQDGEISSEEVKQLLIESPFFKKLYFDIYGELIELDIADLIERIEKLMLTMPEIVGSTVSKSEKSLFSNLLTDLKVQDMALIMSRHVASADDLHQLEALKFDYWTDQWG
tara:strand:- start:46 stop:435 length:390 start_codon:yes stop_codon:yes gene_type:complete